MMWKKYEIVHQLLEKRKTMIAQEGLVYKAKGRSDKVVLQCIAMATRMGEKQSGTFNQRVYPFILHAAEKGNSRTLGSASWTKVEKIKTQERVALYKWVLESEK